MAKAWDLNTDVKFGGMSCPGKTARISLSMERSKVEFDQVDKVFCGNALSGVLTVDKGAKDQKGLPGMEDDVPTLELVCEAHRFGGNKDTFTSSLCMQASAIDTGLLSKFAGKAGHVKLRVEGPADENGDGGEEE